MMKRKEIIKNVLIIFSIFILFSIPWASVFGIQDPGLLEAAGIVQRSAGLVLVTSLFVKLILQIYNKPLTQEMNEEEIREADPNERKQMQFKPTIGVQIILLFLMLMGIMCFLAGIIMISSEIPFENALLMIAGSFLLIGFSLYIWNTIPVLIFAEYSVQIKPYLFFIFGTDRNTIDIRYADITSVSPDAELESDKSNTGGYDRRYRIVISMNGSIQKCGLGWFNSDIVAKIYLRFKEKLGDKVRLE
jgi:magnesium-transporting ATPase (P-type)